MEHVDRPRDLMAHVRGWLRPGGALVVVVVPNRESLHRRLAVRMGIQERARRPLAARPPGGPPARLRPRHARRRPRGRRLPGGATRFGFTLKTVPNSMMLDWPPALMDALTEISPELPARTCCANIGIRAVAPAMSAGGRVAANRRVLARPRAPGRGPRRRRRGRPGRRLGPDRGGLRLEHPPRRHGEPGDRRRPRGDRPARLPARAAPRPRATGPSACCTWSPSARPSAATRAWRGAGSSATRPGCPRWRSPATAARVPDPLARAPSARGGPAETIEGHDLIDRARALGGLVDARRPGGAAHPPDGGRRARSRWPTAAARPPVLLVNHADHCFWLAPRVPDLVREQPPGRRPDVRRAPRRRPRTARRCCPSRPSRRGPARPRRRSPSRAGPARRTPSCWSRWRPPTSSRAIDDIGFLDLVEPVARRDPRRGRAGGRPRRRRALGRGPRPHRRPPARPRAPGRPLRRSWPPPTSSSTPTPARRSPPPSRPPPLGMPGGAPPAAAPPGGDLRHRRARAGRGPRRGPHPRRVPGGRARPPGRRRAEPAPPSAPAPRRPRRRCTTAAAGRGDLEAAYDRAPRVAADRAPAGAPIAPPTRPPRTRTRSCSRCTSASGIDRSPPRARVAAQRRRLPLRPAPRAVGGRPLPRRRRRPDARAGFGGRHLRRSRRRRGDRDRRRLRPRRPRPLIDGPAAATCAWCATRRPWGRRHPSPPPLELAGGQAALLMTSDVVLLPGWLDPLADALARPGVSGAAPAVAAAPAARCAC